MLVAAAGRTFNNLLIPFEREILTQRDDEVCQLEVDSALHLPITLPVNTRLTLRCYLRFSDGGTLIFLGIHKGSVIQHFVLPTRLSKPLRTLVLVDGRTAFEIAHDTFVHPAYFAPEAVRFAI